MGKIDRDQAIQKLLDALPNFSKLWNEHLDFWEGDKPGITNDFSPVTEFTILLLEEPNRDQLKIIANLVEEFICNGDKDVKYGATLGFIEGITNRIGHMSTLPKGWDLFLGFMGSKSKDFLQELDTFWGSKTPGTSED